MLADIHIDNGLLIAVALVLFCVCAIVWLIRTLR